MKNLELATNIYTDKNLFILDANIPGIKPEDIKVSIENNMVKVSAKHEEETEVQKKRFLKHEIEHGEFETSASLPFPVDIQHATAEIKNGSLRIKLPKAAAGEKTQKAVIAVKKA
jgi:HSP20 family protein